MKTKTTSTLTIYNCTDLLEGIKIFDGYTFDVIPIYDTEWVIGEPKGREVYREASFHITKEFDVMTITPKEGIDIELKFETLSTWEKHEELLKKDLSFIEEWRIEETIKDLESQFRFTMLKNRLVRADVLTDFLDRINNETEQQALREHLKGKGMYGILNVFAKKYGEKI